MKKMMLLEFYKVIELVITNRNIFDPLREFPDILRDCMVKMRTLIEVVIFA